jgi:hypothetical protein
LKQIIFKKDNYRESEMATITEEIKVMGTGMEMVITKGLVMEITMALTLEMLMEI